MIMKKEKRKFREVLNGRAFFHHGATWIKFPVIKTDDGDKINAVAIISGALAFISGSIKVEDAMINLGGGKINLNEIF